jgi:HAD superfamily hydrolase (TIGR01509 family)
MNIIIPLGGKGERFSKNGYTQPKPLIKIFEKRMIEYVIDNLSFSNKDTIFIIYNFKLDTFHFSEFIINKYPFIKLIQIGDTKGAVETLFLGIEQILNTHNHNKKCLILDCDTFYTEDIINIFNETSENMVFYTKNDEPNPIYSYIEITENSVITNIQEKNKISDNANTGAYAFADINTLYNYCKYVLDNNIHFNGEPYTSCVISEMIKSKFIFKGYQLNEERTFSLGTPVAVEKYIENTHLFLFDLDGTLVITDDIYFDVWYTILIKYNVILSMDIFKKYIQGNNDKYVVQTLLKNINVDITEVSRMKDELFMLHIHKIKIVEGMYDLLQQIKTAGYKLCIVTNCNKKVANEIILFINIDKLIDFIISSDDCKNGKPYSEPYQRAIDKYNTNNNKCIIFEDSKTGILSGKSIYPKLLIGVETIYSSNELYNFGVNFSIKNFCNLNITHLIKQAKKSIQINYLQEIIRNNSIINNIKDVKINKDQLKSGFIADVIGFKITTNDNQIFSQILKYENTNKNNLSIMANKLRLYEREYYFYTNICHYINNNIKVPKFYNLILDETDNVLGIVLENLFERNYKNNLDLNIESIDVTLKIIDRIAKMHTIFWNRRDIKKIFPNLKSNNDEIFSPFLTDFINEKYHLFKSRWFNIFNTYQIEKCNEIYANFGKIQHRLSNGNITFIHGDVKSFNIFYDIENNHEPYFIDWQHCAIGKGVQDLIFFIIESFDITNIKSVYNISKEYYYKKLLEYGVRNYSIEEYENDIYDAICYIPFFTSVWFGTTPPDELIDKNFPYFFISKFVYLIELTSGRS